MTDTHRDRILRYLADHGPSTSQEIELALGIRQPVISMMMRSNADFIKSQRVPALIYSKRLMSKPPRTTIATVAESVRVNVQTYYDLRALSTDDTTSLDALAQHFINRNVRLMAHLEKQLKGYQDDYS